MEVLLERYDLGKEDTLGNFYIDGVLQCKTLEDQERPVKVKGDTCIPEGRYEIKLRTDGTHHLQYASGHYGPEIQKMHKGMLHICNVPQFEWILIHIGNKDSDTEGCVLPGLTVVQAVPPRRQLVNSKLAYIRIYPIISEALVKGERVFITIKKKANVS